MGTMAITIPMASYTHYKNMNINLEVIKYMFLPAIIATIFGRYVAANIESSILQIIIAISMLLAAIQLAFDFSPKNINKSINKIELFIIKYCTGLLPELFSFDLARFKSAVFLLLLLSLFMSSPSFTISS